MHTLTSSIYFYLNISHYVCASSNCKNGAWKMVGKTDCPAICSAFGDPHYTTFDGYNYEFQGSCSYTLTREKGNLFDITAENLPCGSSGVTCTKSVTIKAYDTLFKLTTGTDVIVNNVTVSSSPSTHVAGQVTISRVGFFVSLYFEFEMTVLWDGGEFSFPNG
jgi:hypothetical protein